MNLRWFGTASLAINEGERSLLIDPFFNRNPLLYQPQMKDFASHDSILVTHGHFDHIQDIEFIYKENPNITIYGTQIVKTTLMKHGIKEESVVVVKPGDTITVNGFEIDIYQGKHVDFGIEMVIDGALKPRTYAHFPRLIKFVASLFTYPENDEIIDFHIKGETDDVFVIGSLGVDPNTKYPEKVSNLVLPYQGSKDILDLAKEIIPMFNPDTVIIDHCDDAFPPQSANVNTDPLINVMTELRPEMNIFRPNVSAVYHLGKLDGVADSCKFAMWENVALLRA